MESKIKIGIIGGAGYTAGELLRLLLLHPQAQVEWVQSESNAGVPLPAVHGGLEGDTDLRFVSEGDLDSIDLIFLCSGHGKSSEFWSNRERPKKLRVIDLAQDYRDEHDGYVYGLPELNADRIAGAVSVANPGCFATAIELALLPLAQAALLPAEINVTALTGSTGAGVKPGATTHFSWRQDNVSVYKPFTHQHLAEIEATLHRLMPCSEPRINFVPVRGGFTRGIYAILSMSAPLTESSLTELYSVFYAGAAFTHLSPREVDLKQVVNTNKALLHLHVANGQLLIVSAIDNLLKGASGQAVQNMNLMFGLEQDAGLRLKPSAF